MKTLEDYQAELWGLFKKNYVWQYKAIEDMLNLPVWVYAKSEDDLLSKWWNIAIELHKMARKVFDANEDIISYRAYQRAAQLLDMFEAKVQQVINYKESLQNELQ